MRTATSSFATEKASGYLQQLCKHFGQKVEATFDETKGFVSFSIGTAEFNAKDGLLHIDVRAETVQNLELTKETVESHLVRFAFREKMQGLEWSK